MSRKNLESESADFFGGLPSLTNTQDNNNDTVTNKMHFNYFETTERPQIWPQNSFFLHTRQYKDLQTYKPSHNQFLLHEIISLSINLILERSCNLDPYIFDIIPLILGSNIRNAFIVRFLLLGFLRNLNSFMKIFILFRNKKLGATSELDL